MNTAIENIQRNMQTVFEGYVNGQKFTDRNAMNAYIGECIANNIPITDFHYSSTSSFNDPTNKPANKPANQPRRQGLAGREAIHNAQREISWITYVNTVNQKVPKPYNNVIGYVVPFIREDINITDSNAGLIIDDFRARLTDRMAFLENLIFSQIRTWKYDENQVNQWLELLANTFTHKLEWANDRIKVIEDFLTNGNDFIVSHIDDIALRGFYVIYSETAGFCSALIDIIREIQQDMAGNR